MNTRVRKPNEKGLIRRRDFIPATALASLSLFAASLVSSGCSRQRSSTLKLAFVPKALNNPVFEVTRAGAEDRAHQLSSVSVRWIGPTIADAVAQSQIIDDLIVQGIDGICITCNDPAALLPAINRGVDAGVAVVTWDSDSPRSKRLTNIGIDQEAAGFKAGELMLGRLTAGKIAVLTGTPGALNLEKRRAGFLKAIAKNARLQIVATDPCNDDVQRAVEIVEQRVNATPDLAGYFFVGMWPFFADLKTLPQLKNFVSQGGICVSLDALEGALNAVERGYASALVGYSWYDFGITAVNALVAYLRGGVKPIDPMFSELFIVDSSNIATYQRRQHESDGHF